MKKTEFRRPWKVIGNKIRRARVRSGLTQGELAERWCRELRELSLGTHIPSATLISKRESGETPSTLGELAAFERVLGLNEAALAGLLIDGQESTAEVVVLLLRMDAARRPALVELMRCASRLADFPESPMASLSSA